MLITKKKIAAALSAVALAGTLAACSDETSSEQKAQESRSKGMENLRAKQKPVTMEWSPILDSVDRRNKTWEKKGKVSYIYMQRQDGSFAGYYVMDGLPVSYCTSGAPTFNWQDIPNDGASTQQQVPAPAGDGAYYTGCDANRYYGFDALTGQYLEYTDGMVLTAVLSDQPLELDKQPRPFGSSVAEVKAKKK